MSASRRRVLMVVSSYRPAMLADMQRARHLSHELPSLGWDVEVLAPDSSEVRADAVDPDSDALFRQGEAMHTVNSLAAPLFDLVGSRSPAWRTLVPMERAGERLLSTGRFDLVYFSTTTFTYFVLGPRWKRKLGVPYVLDFHDPWVRDRGIPKPRGASRRFSAWLARRMERHCVCHADGLVAVSPAYVHALKRRYADCLGSWAGEGRHQVIPFAAREEDLQAALAPGPPPRSGGEVTIAYVGAGGAIMARSFAALCELAAELRSQDPAFPQGLRIRLAGTQYGWVEGQPKVLQEIAARAGIGDLVVEEPQRVSYHTSLERLAHADGALVLGVDDPGYMPSKLFAYALAGKPLLASLHSHGPAHALLRQRPQLGHVIAFDQPHRRAEARETVRRFLLESAARQQVDRRAALEPFLAPAMARRHAELFEACLRRRGPGAGA